MGYENIAFDLLGRHFVRREGLNEFIFIVNERGLVALRRMFLFSFSDRRAIPLGSRGHHEETGLAEGGVAEASLNKLKEAQTVRFGLQTTFRRQ